MKAPPQVLLYTVVLILTHTTTYTLSATHCPPCGTYQVPYPLSTAPSCGDPDYTILCDTNTSTLLFNTLNNTYPITAITPSNQRLTIQPSPLLSNTCVTSDYIHQGVQLNSSLPFNITSSNTIMYLNCTTELLSSPLNCNSTSLCHVYVNNTVVAAACGSSLCCTFRAGGSSTSYSIRVRDSGCRAYTSFVNLDDENPVNQWPEPGLEIQWVVPREPVCESQVDCDGSSTCGPDDLNGSSGISRCFCNSGFTWDPIEGICVKDDCQNPDGCSTDRTPLIAGLTASIGATLIVATLAILVYKRHRLIVEAQERLTREREEILNANGGGRAAKLFTGRDIKKATNNFSKDRLLGAGGYGEVFKGILDDGTVVAVKCAKLGNTKGTDQVLNEVGILCQVNHRNLVRLLGCCVELEQPMLVYEYIENGALSEYLQSLRTGKRALLSWTCRLKIAHDTAEGLAYLHSSAVPPIYHRDVKSSNILLDEKLNAKVSDFGLSRLAHTDLSHISTCAQGTLGYLDPEYYRNYQLTDKSDVYSFGVVLLELLTSQKAIDFNRAADDVNLSVYVQRMVEEEKLMGVVDPLLKEGASTLELDTMKALVLLALGCLEERRQNRPSMKEVAEEIQYIMAILTANR
ncbi:Pkinase_Tyr domain-containing protein/GUB_WAK_bind domain-containing protein [Cephalotus follicularis]|uniref:Pkinase_Tyr domain-containing protein/GUB_WAK_bind domain-containing protein n=1 Tax=Cephalotus follicularis TaxID=3775 RepID=A0A1Q3BQX7_CEPFO|nr:Pkinase_Tyr domain-containing protein/GUB_WAK_bind domain-containing protein [Cephalotus follicularis]